MLATGGQFDHTIRLWNPRSGELLRTIEQVQSVTSVAWNLSGQMLASVSADKTIRIWNTATGDLLHTLDRHAELVSSVSWNGNDRLASGSADKQILLWDVSPHR
jgi:WD40 repeat protein